jgi:beta-glucanase (GH16 family)
MKKVKGSLIMGSLIMGSLIILSLLSCSVNTMDTPTRDNGSVTTEWTYNTQTWAYEGNATSTLTWETGNGTKGWGNNELEYYKPANASVASGILTITAKKESSGGFAYTSARGNGGTLTGNGRVTGRIKCPKGQGLWPCFWLLGSGTWPQCGEIDIMECKNAMALIRSATHWYNDSTANRGDYVVDYAADLTQWHVFNMERGPDYIRTYIDGVKFYEIGVNTGTNPDLNELHNPMHIIIDMAVGGDFPGAPNSSTVFPAKLQIDYMRIFN